MRKSINTSARRSLSSRVDLRDDPELRLEGCEFVDLREGWVPPKIRLPEQGQTVVAIWDPADFPNLLGSALIVRYSGGLWHELSECKSKSETVDGTLVNPMAWRETNAEERYFVGRLKLRKKLDSVRWLLESP